MENCYNKNTFENVTCQMAVFLFISFTQTFQPYNLINQTSIFKEGPYPIHHTLSYNTAPPYNLINRSPTYKESPYSIASPPHSSCRHCWLPLPSNICQDSPNSLPPSNLICLCKYRDSHLKYSMAMGPSYLYNGNSYHGKKASLYSNIPQNLVS